MPSRPIHVDFFNRDAQEVACALLGKIIRHRVENLWLSARIIETTRLGTPEDRDEHLPYRFVDAGYARYCTRNPLRRGQAISAGSTIRL